MENFYKQTKNMKSIKEVFNWFQENEIEPIYQIHSILDGEISITFYEEKENKNILFSEFWYLFDLNNENKNFIKKLIKKY